ncbi:hypothetical protein LguiA_020689 [Lonicera macranthoides]
MACFARIKQVTDPLDEKVKARIIGRDRREPIYFSSGSEHSAENDNVESPCLSDLLNGFLEEDTGSQFPADESGSDREQDSIEDLRRTIKLNDKADRFRNVLLSRVLKAMEVFSYFKSDKSLLRRNVMAFLRNSGYNAAICKTRWESSGGLVGGKHEFIDVVRSEPYTRYFVELDFVGEFEIARPTNQYEHLLQTLPRVFIGNGDYLKMIVKMMSDGARRSLKSKELHFPPWRKNRYMQNKWFSDYRRTVNLLPEKTSSLSKLNVECRSVGFDPVNVNGRSFFTAGIAK